MRLAARCAPVAVALALLGAAPASADGLKAGAGRADVTPRTGYYFFGWVRGDARGEGQHTRLFARSLVLERAGRKVALVSVDLGAVPNGLTLDVLERLKGRGFAQDNVVFSASHTHGGPAGFFNFSSYNFVAPTLQTPLNFEAAPPADPELYTFLAKQLAASIRRADDDRAPARAAWASRRLLGVTANRSIEAHLANHGILREYGEGSVALDPQGYEHTIDPEVSVLRVDKRVRRTVRCSSAKRAPAEHRGTSRRAPAFTGSIAKRCTKKVNRPIGMWSSFADHGTVNKATFERYNADHHGAATRVVEAKLRRLGRVPRGQEVVNAYGNTDEGDMSAGLTRSGPADAEHVGRIEADTMVGAWKDAGSRLSGNPVLDFRWTRVCFCGQQTSAGAVDDTSILGVPFLTGSEEGRGPLYDETQVPFEGRRTPVSSGPQGHKVPVLPSPGESALRAVPLNTVRVGERLIATVPGEMTAEMGRRLRLAVLDAAGGGISRVVIAGLSNEFLQYFTTPEEYERQHYEGGSMLFGRTASVLLQDSLADLAARMATGRRAPAPYPFDPKQGVNDDGPAFGSGAGSGRASGQPRSTQRLDRAVFAWSGGEQGLDRPVDRPFVRVERRIDGRWRKATNDLGLQILWTVDDEGGHRAFWEVPLSAKTGSYRFVVTAKRYTLASASFAVVPAADLTPLVVSSGGGRALVAVDYPTAVENVDFTYRPPRARGGSAEFLIGGERRSARSRRELGVTIEGEPGQSVTIPRGALRDRHGNRSRRALSFRL